MTDFVRMLVCEENDREMCAEFYKEKAQNYACVPQAPISMRSQMIVDAGEVFQH